MEHGIILYVAAQATVQYGPAGVGVQGYAFLNIQGKKGSGCTTDYLTNLGYYSKSSSASKAVGDDDDEQGDENGEQPVSSGPFAIDKTKKEPLPVKANSKIEVTRYIEIADHIPRVTQRYEVEIAALKKALKKIEEYQIEIDKPMTASIKALFSKAVIALNFVDVWPNQEWRHNGRTIQYLAEVKALFAQYKATKEALDTRGSALEITRDFDAYNQGVQLAVDFGRIASSHPENVLENYADPKGYWKLQNEASTFLKKAFAYYISNPCSRVPGEYFLGGNIDNEVLGHRVVDATYTYARLNEPNAVLETVFDRLIAASGNTDVILNVSMSELLRPRIVKLIGMFKHPFAKSHPKLVNFSVGEAGVAEEQYPPRVALRAFEAMAQLRNIHDIVLANRLSPDFHLLDITDRFYQQDAKGKNRIKPEVTSATKSMKIEAHIGDKIASVPINLGIDLPTRDDIKRIELLNPSIRLVMQVIGGNTLRFYTFVKSDEGTALYSGHYSNLFLLFLLTPKHHE